MIVVTGSNGFIGSNLIRNLNALGISDILAVDNHDNKELKINVKDCQIKEQQGIKDFLESIKKGQINPSELKAIFHQGAVQTPWNGMQNISLKLTCFIQKNCLISAWRI